MKVDGAPCVTFETGVEEARRVPQRGALGEGHLYDILVDLAGADKPVMRPNRGAQRIGRLYLLYFLDDFRVGLLDQSAETGKHLYAPVG